MPKKHPRLAFLLTVIPAALGALIAIYHLFEIARTVASPEYTQMLGGFSGSLYLIFDYLVMSLPICMLLLLSLLLNLFWSRALSKAWSLSAIAAITVFLVCGLLMILGIHSGQLTVSLHIAARAIAQSITAITLTHSLTKSYIENKKGQ